MVYPYDRILFAIKRKEILTHATTWIKLEDIILSRRGQAIKDHLMSESMDMKCPEKQIYGYRK